MLLPDHFFDLSLFSHKKIFIDSCPVWESLQNIKNYIASAKLGAIECFIPPHAILIDSEKISIGQGTIVEPGAYIQGPCIIGANCQIRHGAYIRGNVIIGNSVVIGHASEVKHSILLDGAKAPHFNYVGDSILGSRVNLGAGVICANFRLDHQEIRIRRGQKRWQTGVKKMGAILGDDSQIGCNSVLSPGLLLDKKTVAQPCRSLLNAADGGRHD